MCVRPGEQAARDCHSRAKLSTHTYTQLKLHSQTALRMCDHVLRAGVLSESSRSPHVSTYLDSSFPASAGLLVLVLQRRRWSS